MKNKSYKIIHVTSELARFFIGGIGTVVTELYNGRKEDEGFLFVAPTGTPLTIYNQDLAEDVFKISLDLYNSIREFPIECDVIFIHSPLLLSDVRFNTSAKKILVIHSIAMYEQKFLNHDVDSGIKDLFMAIIKADELVTVSNDDKIKLEKILRQNNILGKKINVIHNGIQIPKHLKPNIAENNLFGYIGRIDDRKGLFHLLQEMIPIDDYKLLLACGGKGNFLPLLIERLSALISANNGKVIPLGLVKGERKENFFREIEVLIIPSLYEPFGMVVLEAIAKGKPIILSKIGGMVEILGEDYPLYFNPFIPGDFKRAVDKYSKLKRSEEIKSLVERNFSRLKMFSVSNMLDKYRAVN